VAFGQLGRTVTPKPDHAAALGVWLRLDINQLGCRKVQYWLRLVWNNEPATRLTISIELEQWMLANFRAHYDL